MGNRFIKPELVKYLKETNEKSFEKFINYNKNKIDLKKINFKNLDFNKEYLKKEDFYNVVEKNHNYILLTIVGLFSFLAGYNFRSL
jgi:hypothetical protein